MLTNHNNNPSALSIVVAGILLFVSSVVWYLLDGGLIETGGDAIGRWEDLTTLVIGGVGLNSDWALVFDHHALRWGINLPVLAILKIGGSNHPAIYHLIMPVFGGATAVAIYLIIRCGLPQLSRELVFCSLTLSLMIISLSERPFSQLLPMGAATCYMCMALVFMKLALNPASKHPVWWYFLAGLGVLFAYGTKLTMIWFGLPLSLFVFGQCLRDRDLLKAVVFFGPLVLGLLVEAVLLNQGTGSLLGRALYFVSEESEHGFNLQHLHIPSAGALTAGWGFNTLSNYLLLSPTKYYEALGKYSVVIYGTVLYIIYSLIFVGPRASNKRFEVCLSWTILGFFLLQTYMVVRISPYIFPEQYVYARYQYPLLVLCAIFCFLKFVGIWEKDSVNAEKLKPRLFPILAVLILVSSMLFLANNVFTKHNNLGILVTLLHNKVLAEWIEHGGNVGYRNQIESHSNLTELRQQLDNSPNAKIIPLYVGSVYQLPYCDVSETYVYFDVERVYGFCSPWRPNESILFYYATSLEQIRPERLNFLGKYSDLKD